MSESDTRAIVRELYDAYGRRNFACVAALNPRHRLGDLCADVGDSVCRSAVLETMADIAKTFALEGYKPEVMIVDGARTALISDIGYGQRATNRVFWPRDTGFLCWHDGRLIEYREFIDSFDVVEQALGRELLL